jgi:hypothetical protein
MGVDVNMLATTAKQLSDVDIRNLSYRLCEAFGYQEFWQDVRKGQFALSRVIEDSYAYEWLPKHVARDSGTIIMVNQSWRYYGPGYERGSLPTIIGVAEWLSRNNLDVWYGGDSDERVYLFDSVARDKLREHFAKNGGGPYRSGFGSGDYKLECPYCVNPLRVYIWGPAGARSYSCPGCGYQCTRSSDGTIIVDKEPED